MSHALKELIKNPTLNQHHQVWQLIELFVNNNKSIGSQNIQKYLLSTFTSLIIQSATYGQRVLDLFQSFFDSTKTSTDEYIITTLRSTLYALIIYNKNFDKEKLFDLATSFLLNYQQNTNNDVQCSLLMIIASLIRNSRHFPPHHNQIFEHAKTILNATQSSTNELVQIGQLKTIAELIRNPIFFEHHEQILNLTRTILTSTQSSTNESVKNERLKTIATLTVNPNLSEHFTTMLNLFITTELIHQASTNKFIDATQIVPTTSTQKAPNQPDRPEETPATQNVLKFPKTVKNACIGTATTMATAAASIGAVFALVFAIK